MPCVFTFHTGGFILNCELYLQHRHKLQWLPKGGCILSTQGKQTPPFNFSPVFRVQRTTSYIRPLFCILTIRARESNAQGLEWSAEDELRHNFFPEITLSEYKSRKKGPNPSCLSITEFSSLPSAFSSSWWPPQLILALLRYLPTELLPVGTARSL